ncbi:unnamed protein product [Clavelina lepadiformis]|uniref:Fibrinogen C-terminal domain-containing protein n=1 Tax=Clavelina lepadiformis TaxID=159417 RepID=A0ABP0FKL0_CLALP
MLVFFHHAYFYSGCSKLRRRMTALGFLLLLIIVAASVGGYFGYVAGILNPSNQTDASATPTVNASPESTTTTSSGIGEVQNATELAHTRSNTVTGLESTTPSPDLPRSCQDHYTSGSDTSGVYTIYPISDPIQVYCDQVRDGGGWTVIQRRLNGSLNFNRPWLDYRRGFGSASGEYWLGLDLISAITRAGIQELRIDFVKSLFSQHGYAKYSRWNSQYDLRFPPPHHTHKPQSLPPNTCKNLSGIIRRRLIRSHPGCSDFHATLPSFYGWTNELHLNNCNAPAQMAVSVLIVGIAYLVKQEALNGASVTDWSPEKQKKELSRDQDPLVGGIGKFSSDARR